MEPRSLSQKLLAGMSLTSADQAVLLAGARRVVQARRAGNLATMLQGRHLALMAHAEDEDVRLFEQAATEMGAKVARVSPVAANCTPAELQAMGRLLSQLYDAVECQGMPARLVRELALSTNLPVFDGLANPQHPVVALHAGLEDVLTGPMLVAHRRQLLTQAALLTSIN